MRRVSQRHAVTFFSFGLLRRGADVGVVGLGGETKRVDSFVGVFPAWGNVDEHQRLGAAHQVVLKQLGQQRIPAEWMASRGRTNC